MNPGLGTPARFAHGFLAGMATLSKCCRAEKFPPRNHEFQSFWLEYLN
jgi:hypothetical protein